MENQKAADRVVRDETRDNYWNVKVRVRGVERRRCLPNTRKKRSEESMWGRVCGVGAFVEISRLVSFAKVTVDFCY